MQQDSSTQNHFPLVSTARLARGVLLASLLAGCAGEDNADSPVTMTPTGSGAPTASVPSPVSPGTGPSQTASVAPTPSTGPSPSLTASGPTGPTAPSGGSGGMPPVTPDPGPGAGGVPTPAAGGTPPVGAGGTGGTPQGMAGTGGMGGAGPTPVDTNPVPEASGNTYSITVGELTFTSDGPSGRVTGLMFGGGNLLTTSAIHETNYGSSFWTSPQDWDWPPGIDAADYTHSIDGESIVFVSDEVELPANTVSVTKSFSGNASDGSIQLEYVVTNLGSGSLTFAPWEITRVFNDGITFYPRGMNDPHAQTGEYSPEAIPTVTLGDDMVWYDFSGNDGESKSVSDGAEGWLAHVADGVLLLKVWDDVTVADQFDTEGEVEIYSGPDDSYIELEQQGPRQTVASGEQSAPWSVRWYVRSLPTDVDVSVGSESLASWVRGFVAAPQP